MYYLEYVNRKVHVVCNFNYLLENEGLLKVTAGHMHYKCGRMSETVSGRVVVSTEYAVMLVEIW